MVKPPLRTKSIGFKVSQEEYAQLETAAQKPGETWGQTGRFSFSTNFIQFRNSAGKALLVSDPTGSYEQQGKLTRGAARAAPASLWGKRAGSAAAVEQ